MRATAIGRATPRVRPHLRTSTTELRARELDAHASPSSQHHPQARPGWAHHGAHQSPLVPETHARMALPVKLRKCSRKCLQLIHLLFTSHPSAVPVNRVLLSDSRHASLHRRQLQRDRIDAQMLAKQLIDLRRQGRVRWRRAHHAARLPDCIWDAERRVQLQERADLVDPLHESHLRRRRGRG